MARELIQTGVAATPSAATRALIPRSDAWYDKAPSTGYEKRLATSDANPAGFSSWNAALARRESRRANVVLLGESIAEGFPVTSYTLTVAMQLAGVLRARFPTSGDVGGRGFVGVPTQGTSPALVTPWTIVGGAFDPTTVGAAEAFFIGPARNCWYTNGSGTATYLCGPHTTAIDLHHVKGVGGGATGAYYKINGGAAVPFSTLNATAVVANLRITVPAGASVEFGCNTGGQYIIIAGVQEYAGDELKGIQVHNAGHSGYTAAKWSANATTAGGWRESLAVLNPDLLVIQLGGNDCQVNSAATFKTNLATLISTLRAGSSPLPTVPILLLGMYDPTGPGSGNGVIPVDPWHKYVDAMRSLAYADPTLGFEDMSARMPTGQADTKGLYYTDKVHGAADGSAYEWIAQRIADAVSPQWGDGELRPKRFWPGELLMQSPALGVVDAEPYSDANPPFTLMVSESGATVPPTPAAGQAVLYNVDGSVLLMKDDAGTVRTIGGGTKISALTAATALTGSDTQPIVNGGVTKKVSLDTQVAYVRDRMRRTSSHTSFQTGFNADSYLNGSALVFPAGAVTAKSVYRVRFEVSKTAAGVATPVITFRGGTLGTTADAAITNVTFAAQSAVVDSGWFDLTFNFRSVGSGTSAVVAATGRLFHQLITTGLSTTAVFTRFNNTSAGFNSTTQTTFGVSVNGGTSASWTVTLVDAEMDIAG